ncbi:MAG: BTAD domain-containing putative transcriptional regulator, partial [Stackebrandtia sp.]
PDTARRQVQNVVAGLRRSLTDVTGPDRPPTDVAIEARADGYRIQVPAESVDVHRFTSLVRDAAAARARGDTAGAAGQLHTALDLWRGDGIGGQSGRALDAAGTRLFETRLTATEDRVDLDLELRESTSVIGELQELVGRHPLRQRFAGQLMTALHRAGRTPEALEVFAHLRTRLSEQLGIDPSPQLSDLHTAILRDEHPPSTTAGSVVQPATPIPAQLPAAPGSFTGRAEHLDTLDRLVVEGRGTAVISAIAGMGGVGKTALALHWAHRARGRFPDGQLYINLRGYDTAEPVPAVEALARFLTALGQPSASIPTDVDDAAALYRSILADRRMLIVLDNARNAAQVRPLLPGGSGNIALITTRNSLSSLVAIEDAVPVHLESLDH